MIKLLLLLLLLLEIPRKNLRRLEANEFTLVPERPVVVPCTTSGSGVLVRNVFPVPFELKFCQFDFD